VTAAPESFIAAALLSRSLHTPQTATPTTAVALLGISIIGSVALSGRRWTVSALLTVLIAAQVVFHVAFGDHPTGLAPPDHHAAHGLSASMLLAHLLAAIIAALLLRRGESWCWRLVALLSRPVRVARVLTARPVLDSGSRSVQVAGGPTPSRRFLLLADAQPRRGPPALFAR
jgi:hypothetical protein